jgi:transposase
MIMRRRGASIYHIVRDRVPYRELGADWSARRYSPEHRARRLVRQLEALGLKVTVEAGRLKH